MEGAAAGRKEALENDFAENGALQYAAIRNILLRKGKTIEVLANYEPSLHYVSEWWKQLYGESEGKDQKGIFPASVDLTTDLHSMGQFIQDGNRILFETVVNIPEQNEYYLGQLFYFFEFACGISGYLLGVNPFNQPGVESYKKNMFALLGKPGFEAEREELLKRL